MTNPFKSLEREIKKGINRLGDQIKDGLRSLGREIESGLRRAGNEVEGKLKSAGNEIESGFKKAGNEVEAGLRQAGKEIEDDLTKKLPDLAEEIIEDVIDELAKAVTKEGLTVMRSVVKESKTKLDQWRTTEYSEEIDKIGVDIQLGPVTLAYANFYNRADLLSDSLNTWINEPPTLRRKPIMDLIEALAPDSVNMGVDFEFALVIGSDSLGVGISLSSIPTKIFMLIGDDILKELGVPA